MARLDPLIRYRRHQVDEKRRALAELFRQMERLQNHKDGLLMSLAREQALAEASDQLDTRMYFGLFAQGVREKTEQIDADIARLQHRVALAQDLVREAFSDLKKVEITARERKKAEDKKNQDRETATLDEIGIDRHNRAQRIETENSE